jgi:dCMP deaminase
MNASRDKWDRRFIEMAQMVATWSKDPSTRCAAVIVDPDRRVISVGFNGFPRHVEDAADRLLDRETKLRLTLHAEENAIAFAHRDLSGCTIYTTHHPCALCAARIIQNGLAVVVHGTDASYEQRWAADIELARQAFDEAGVSVLRVIDIRQEGVAP